MLMGKIIAASAMEENKFVTWLPAYGPEVRGGTAHCMITISDEEIGSPYINKADSLVIMNALSMAKFKDRITKSGLLIVNSSLAESDRKINSLQKPFTDIALKLGNIKVANMIALGCFAVNKKVIKLKSIKEEILKIAPADKKELIEINMCALEEGAKLI